MSRLNDQRKAALLRVLHPSSPLSAATIEHRLNRAGFEQTRRTLERDLQELVTTGDVLASEGKPRQYRRQITSAVKLNRPLDATEAVVLQLAEAHLSRLLPAHMATVFGDLFKQARASLQQTGLTWADGQPRLPLARWADLVQAESEWLPRLVPPVAAAVDEAVSEALLRRQQLALLYRKRRASEDKDAIVSPLGLVQRGPVTFLVVARRADSDPYLLALHRIAQARVLPESAIAPPGFKLKDWLTTGQMQFRVQGQIELVLAITDEARVGLQEAPLAIGQTITPLDDGRHRLAVILNHSLQLEWWLLGMADAVEVISPSTLRTAISARLRGALARY
jgi:predicted DNA-binding transcriptional regulator YafY